MGSDDNQERESQSRVVHGVYDNVRHRVGGVFRFAFLQSPARTAVVTFALAALVGAFLLSLPVSSEKGQWTNYIDCLFTSTSAVCVTGLLVKSTPDHWTMFGELVILGLIQVGGLGIMTLGAFVASVLRKGMSMRFERFMKTLVESQVEDNVLWLVGFICLFTFIAELIGAVTLYISWQDADQFIGKPWLCVYHSIFHSISAFCNAGFSLNNNSLETYQGTFSVSFIVSMLIIAGGIGFTVVRDVETYVRWWLFSRRGKKPRLSTHTRLVLVTTGVLLLVGFVGVLALEWNNETLQGTDLETKVSSAIFHSVTPRTAGFNTMKMGALAPATIFLTIVLMFIGGSPGGTAGGIKTSTLGVMFTSVLATLRGREKAEMFHHSVSEETVHRVASIILLSFAVVVTGVFVLLMTEQGTTLSGSDEPVRFEHVMFESVSAFGTVGLSTGLTGMNTHMTAAGKLVITMLMFVGRLGPIALILSIASLKETAVYSYPEDRILVG